MVSLAERGSYVPTLITSGIVIVLVIFSAYGYFAAGSRLTLPFTRYVLITITAIYFIRGAAGLFFILNPLGRPPEFWLWSSLICLAFGIVHFIGVKQLYCV
ncbi:hypothetical protein [Agarilytica rhodophyticola]|uniref:hypothetical protein n=1 Tax=Agarilytica rhodophyticola TaxID=1737490 RepID=UPI001C1FD0F0|nr:hypothetical protein [Agarilytica rhodophyticola]